MGGGGQGQIHGLNAIVLQHLFVGTVKMGHLVFRGVGGRPLFVSGPDHQALDLFGVGEGGNVFASNVGGAQDADVDGLHECVQGRGPADSPKTLSP